MLNLNTVVTPEAAQAPQLPQAPGKIASLVNRARAKASDLYQQATVENMKAGAVSLYQKATAHQADEVIISTLTPLALESISEQKLSPSVILDKLAQAREKAELQVKMLVRQYKKDVAQRHYDAQFAKAEEAFKASIASASHADLVALHQQLQSWQKQLKFDRDNAGILMLPQSFVPEAFLSECQNRADELRSNLSKATLMANAIAMLEQTQQWKDFVAAAETLIGENTDAQGNLPVTEANVKDLAKSAIAAAVAGSLAQLQNQKQEAILKAGQ